MTNPFFKTPVDKPHLIRGGSGLKAEIALLYRQLFAAFDLVKSAIDLGGGVFKTLDVNLAQAAGSHDATIYVAPAGEIVSYVYAKVIQAPVGSGSAVLTAGVTAGGAELLAAQTLNNATALGKIYGVDSAEKGTDLTAGQKLYTTTQTVQCRVAVTGTLTAGKVRFYYYSIELA